MRKFGIDLNLKSASYSLAVATIWITLFTTFHHSDLGSYWEEQFARKIEFNLREKLGKSPRIHPRLKIYALDDNTVSHFNKPELSYTEWSYLFNALSTAKVNRIFVDKIFGLIPKDHPEIQDLIDVLKQSVSVNVGGFYMKNKIPWRITMEDHLEKISLKNSAINMSKMDWLTINKNFVYGPSPIVRSYFHQVGHINYAQDGKVNLFQRYSKEHFIPHLTLHLADRIVADENGISIDGIKQSLDHSNKLVINFPSVMELYQNTYSLKSLLVAATDGRVSASVKEDDVVIILPLFYTGNVDIGQTPIGNVPRGFVLVSMLNSILNKQWIRSFDHGFLFLFLAGLFGIFFGSQPTFIRFISSTLIGVIGTFISGIVLFSHFSIIIPWLYPSIEIFLISGTIYLRLAYERDRSSQGLRVALGGLVSQDKLDRLMESPFEMQREGSEQMVSLVFLDIVGFSIIAQQKQPREVFETLREVMGIYTTIIHKHGGTVDRTLGDGMLCFFGYSYVGHHTNDNHADQAINCAIEIQNRTLELAEALAEKQMGFPVRIGINTSSVFIGDLGNEDRIDFTLIGDGVNFAQRLEAASSPFFINCSQDTILAASQFDKDMANIDQRQIQIKHHENLIKAYEISPFFGNIELNSRVQNILRKIYYGERKSRRVPIDDQYDLKFSSKFGEAHLVDFSLSGFSVRLETYLAKSVNIRFEFQLQDHSLKQQLVDRGLDKLICEVRWGRKVRDEYLHGVQLKNLSTDQMEFLFHALEDHFTTNK